MPSRPIPSWLIVLICGATVLTLSMGARQVSGLFLRPVAMDLGLSREAFGTAVAIQNLVWGLAQPFAGLLGDRYGARPVVIGAGLLYAAGLAMAGLASDSMTFTLGLGLLCGLGQAGTAFAVALAVIGRTAPADRRSLAIGLGSTAGSIGVFLMVPMTSALIERFDWRPSMLALAGAVMLMPLLGLALREQPSPRGAGTASGWQAAGIAHRDRDYWLLNLGFATCGFQLAFVATYMPTVLIDGGLGLSAGAAVLMAIGLFNILGTWLCGMAGVRWQKSRVLAAIYVARAAAMIGFLMMPLSMTSALVFGAAIGLLWTGTVPLTSSLVADLWGRRNLGFLFGLVYIGHQLGAFLGAWAGGFAYDHTGSFEIVWTISIAISISAAICHLLLVEQPRPIALAEGNT
ncbi:MAG: MFS transporter [Alphaproteobacteria bacterium]|nr:MFS transporter [Alphaproteobacteria bacterium]